MSKRLKGNMISLQLLSKNDFFPEKLFRRGKIFAVSLFFFLFSFFSLPALLPLFLSLIPSYTLLLSFSLALSLSLSLSLSLFLILSLLGKSRWEKINYWLFALLVRKRLFFPSHSNSFFLFLSFSRSIFCNLTFDLQLFITSALIERHKNIFIYK